MNPSPSQDTFLINNDGIDNSNANSTLSFKKSEFSFLQDFSNIVDLILTGSNQDVIGKAVAQLDERFEHARQVLEDLPGLHNVKEEQEEILQTEINVLEHRKQQLNKYLSLSIFNNNE
jgi:Cu/Ag efflux pump CusA